MQGRGSFINPFHTCDAGFFFPGWCFFLVPIFFKLEIHDPFSHGFWGEVIFSCFDLKAGALEHKPGMPVPTEARFQTLCVFFCCCGMLEQISQSVIGVM